MLPKATYCRCGYASPSGAPRCLGCGRGTTPVAPHELTLPAIPLGPLVIAALTAGAWLGPDEHRAHVLTLAALVGAALAAGGRVPATSAASEATATATATAPNPIRRDRLTDDELRAAILAW